MKVFGYRLPMSLAVLCLAACGGGGSNGFAGESASDARGVTISLNVAGNGTVTEPDSSYTLNTTASFQLAPSPGHYLKRAEGCGGEQSNNTFTTGTLTRSCTISVQFAPEVLSSLSGILITKSPLQLDGDTLTEGLDSVDNSQDFLAQPISKGEDVQGYVSRASVVRGAQTLTSDADDFFWLQLAAGDTVALTISDFPAAESSVTRDSDFDLDLYLYELNGDLVDFSQDLGETEQVSAPQEGEYLVQVTAYGGGSKYHLRVLPSADGLLPAATAASKVDFVPNQMIVKREDAPSYSSSGYAHYTAASVARMSTAKTGPRLVQVDPAQRVLVAPRATVALQRLQAVSPAAVEKFATLQSIKNAREEKGVAYAEPNYIRRGMAVTPTDTGYRRQWNLRSIRLPQAWELTTGSKSGEEVIVAVLDSGVVTDHPDLRDKLLPGYDFIFEPLFAADGDGRDPDPSDPGDAVLSQWHGTHVAGIVSAASDNAVGIAGVSWGAKIMPLRILGPDATGQSFDMMEAIRYAAGLPNDTGLLPARRADIINLSLGGASFSQAEADLIEEVRAEGVIVVASAGNYSGATPLYPAAYPGVIAVLATDALDQRASYSNYGGDQTVVSVAAPGGEKNVDRDGDGFSDEIFSTVGHWTGGPVESTYGYLHGTSMASPQVAGVIALMKAAYPALSPGDVDTLLKTGAITRDLGSSGWDTAYGYGIIDAAVAVQVAQDLAQGGELPELPPLIQSNPGSVQLWFDDAAEFTLTNVGGGLSEISAVEAVEDWLEVRPVEVETHGLGRYRVTVDRLHLAPGYHKGRVTVESAGGQRLELPVTLRVASAQGGSDLHHVRVYLRNLWTGNIDSMASVERTTGEFRFQFNEVAVGAHRIEAGSDIDRNGVRCEAGEVFGFASLDIDATPEPVTVQLDLLETDETASSCD